MDRSTLGHNLRPLQRDGLVALGRDPRDRRARAVTLTRKGKAKLAATLPLWAKAHARFERAFGAHRAARLRKLLAQIEAALFRSRGVQRSVGDRASGGIAAEFRIREE